MYSLQDGNMWSILKGNEVPALRTIWKLLEAVGVVSAMVIGCHSTGPQSVLMVAHFVALKNW